MGKLTINLFLFVCILQCVTSAITNKEYALLPPVFELDDFNRCMLLGDEALYCYMEFHVKPLDPNNTTLTWQQIEQLNKSPKNYRHDNLRRGICVPFTCPSIKMSHNDPKFKDALAECYNKKYETSGIYGTIGNIYCYTKEPKKFDFLDYAASVFFISYALFVLYASFYEGFARYKTPEEYRKITGTTYGKILTCFSIPANWSRLISKRDDEETKSLQPLQGIRFYNYVIITFTHAVMGSMMIPVSNTMWSEKTSEKFLTIFIASGSFAVQTNFLMSLWLLTYQIFKEFGEKSHKQLNLKTILVITFHRYLRLVTPLAFIILFQCTLLYHTGQSPIWDPIIGREKEYCRENGWTNLLLVNNIINSHRMCFTETWYVAVDLQEFVLGLAILYFTVKNPKRLWWIVPSVWIVTKIIQAKQMSDFNVYQYYSADPENIYLLRGIYEVDGVWQHTMPDSFTHSGGALVGILGGYLFYKYRGQQLFTKTIHVFLWWIFTFGMCLALIIFPGLWLFSPSYYPTKLFSLTHYTISPALFAIGIALGIFGFSRNVGWIANWVTNWNPVYFLGKLTYSAFLSHYPVLLLRNSFAGRLEHLDEFNMAFESIEVTASSLLLGLLLCLMVEFPTSAIQKLLLTKEIQQGAIEKNDSDAYKQKKS